MEEEIDLSASIRLFANSPDWVCIIDRDGAVVGMNSTGERACGTRNYAGTPWWQIWPQETAAAVDSALKGARAGGVGRFASSLESEPGHVRTWDVVVTPYSDKEAGCCLLAIARDITELAAARSERTEYAQRFLALADNMAQLAWMADRTGRIFWYNQRWNEFTGTTPDEMIDRGWQSLLHPAHAELTTNKLVQHILSGEDWVDTFPLRGSDGNYCWFLSTARAQRDDNGRIVLWCGTHTDISEQRDAGARLRQKARLIELSHEAIMVWEEGSGISTWNRGCEELYGYARSEAIGHQSHDLLGTKYPTLVESFEKRLLETGAWSGELLQFAKDGRPVWVDSRQEVLNVDGRKLVLETNRDITGRRQAEKIRNLLIGELNHRVKNTLAIVQSIATQTARSTRSLPEFTDSFIDRVQSLAAAHNVLSEASWVGASLGDIVRSQVIVQTEAPDAIAISGPLLQLPPQIAIQMSLILRELASNARRHGALSWAGGRVSVNWGIEPGTPLTLRLNWKESGGPPVVAPKAKGFGTTLLARLANQPPLAATVSFEPGGVVCEVVAEIPDASEDRVFNPGARLETGAAAPLMTALTSSRLVSPPIREVAPKTKRVLVIEDEALIALDIETILNEVGLGTVGPAATVAEALELISTTTFDVALVDGNLMGQPADAIVDELQLRGKPFAFVTGFTRGVLPVKNSTAPIIPKPVNGNMLVQVVQALLGSS